MNNQSILSDINAHLKYAVLAIYPKIKTFFIPALHVNREHAVEYARAAGNDHKQITFDVVLLSNVESYASERGLKLLNNHNVGMETGRTMKAKAVPVGEPAPVEEMTLRDKLAAQVMAELITSGNTMFQNDLELCSKMAYQSADQMIKQRDRKPVAKATFVEFE